MGQIEPSFGIINLDNKNYVDNKNTSALLELFKKTAFVDITKSQQLAILCCLIKFIII